MTIMGFNRKTGYSVLYLSINKENLGIIFMHQENRSHLKFPLPSAELKNIRKILNNDKYLNLMS